MRNLSFFTGVKCLGNVRFPGLIWCAWLCLSFPFFGLPDAAAQQAYSASTPPPEAAIPCQAEAPGSISMPVAASGLSGTVTDISGAVIPSATLTFTASDGQHEQIASDGEGQFHLQDLPPALYSLTVVAPGFEVRTLAADLRQGRCPAPWDVVLSVAPQGAGVEVSATLRDVAEAQMSFGEQQRVLGVIPNFYASYVWDASPLDARQKFRLAWRFATDPATVVMAGVMAGAEQAENTFSGYGQGSRGYLKRFGAGYGDVFNSTLIGQAVLPALFRQDPRYFVKGTGSVPARALYAIATTVICKGDNGHWQANYSNILGNIASAGISDLYYPASSRHGLGLTISNSLVTTALGAVGGLFQEFVLRSMTPHVPDYAALHQ